MLGLENAKTHEKEGILFSMGVHAVLVLTVVFAVTKAIQKAQQQEQAKLEQEMQQPRPEEKKEVVEFTVEEQKPASAPAEQGTGPGTPTEAEIKLAAAEARAAEVEMENIKLKREAAFKEEDMERQIKWEIHRQSLAREEVRKQLKEEQNQRLEQASLAEKRRMEDLEYNANVQKQLQMQAQQQAQAYYQQQRDADSSREQQLANMNRQHAEDLEMQRRIMQGQLDAQRTSSGNEIFRLKQGTTTYSTTRGNGDGTSTTVSTSRSLGNGRPRPAYGSNYGGPREYGTYRNTSTMTVSVHDTRTTTKDGVYESRLRTGTLTNTSEGTDDGMGHVKSIDEVNASKNAGTAGGNLVPGKLNNNFIPVGAKIKIGRN